MLPGKPSTRRNILIFLVSILLGLGIAEVGLRFIMGNMDTVPMSVNLADGRCVGLKSGGSSFYTGWLFRVHGIRQEANRFGYRGAEVPCERKEGVFRIVVVGDSFTYGMGVAADQTIPARLEAHIREMTGRDVEVLNFGEPGLNLEECYDDYRYFARKWNPDLVLYLMDSNDLGDPLCAMVKSARLMWFLKNVYTFRLAYHVFGAKYLIADDAPMSEKTRRLHTVFADFSASLRADGSELAVGVLNSQPADRKSVFQEVFQEFDVRFLDVHSAVDEEPPEIAGEGHYSVEGNDIVARALAKWLVPIWFK